MLTVILLVISNVFMVIAWYGHLKFKETPLWTVILISWGIAFFEYCFQVPANRYGHGQFTTTQLKVIQMIVTLVVFSVFVVAYMGEPLAWNHFVAFVLLIAAGFFVFGFEQHVDAPNSTSALTETQDSPKHNETADSKLPH
jgi:uncharacterized protein